MDKVIVELIIRTNLKIKYLTIVACIDFATK